MAGQDSLVPYDSSVEDTIDSFDHFHDEGDALLPRSQPIEPSIIFDDDERNPSHASHVRFKTKRRKVIFRLYNYVINI